MEIIIYVSSIFFKLIISSFLRENAKNKNPLWVNTGCFTILSGFTILHKNIEYVNYN